jgi:class 3 adenylate cyclase
VIEGPRASTIFSEIKLPVLAMEVEPGESFLIKDLAAYSDLRHELKGIGAAETERKTLLNIDVAHLKLIEHNSRGGDKPLEVIRRDLRERVAHMHLSDHARTHASDLAPGAYHFFSDYEDWLELARDLRNARERTYSGVIAIELEACNDIHEATRAIGRVSRWLDQINRDAPQASNIRLDCGVILVVDIGNSTRHFFGDRGGGVKGLEDRVSEVCKRVHGKRGSVLSFTGDGVIAFFDERHFLRGPKEAAENAQAAAVEILHLFPGATELSLRIALHYGHVYVPTAGPLRHQAIGEDVVVTARLCDWISKTIEPAVPHERRSCAVAATRKFCDLLPTRINDEGFKFKLWGKEYLKGLREPVEIYVERRYLLDPNGAIPVPANPPVVLMT